MTQRRGGRLGFVAQTHGGVGGLRARATRPALVAQGHGADHRFDAAGRAQRVASRPLGGVAGHAPAKHRRHRQAFGGVVGGRGGAVQVDVVDVGRLQTGSAQSGLHRQAGAQTLGVRRGHVVCITGLADTQKKNVASRHSGVSLQQRKARTLADRQAVARRVVGPTGLGGGELQGSKAVQRGETKRVDTADHRGVDRAHGDLPCRRCEHLGTGRTRGRHRHCHAFKAQVLARKRGKRKRVVRAAVVKVVG